MARTRIKPRKRTGDIPRRKKYYRPTKKGAGMTRAGIRAYRRANPGSKLSMAVTGKVSLVVKQLKEENLIVQDH